MEKKRKFAFRQPLDRLEVYMLAADNPVGKRQLRPIFRRKRSKTVLTREQVTAIKRGRRVLRRDMKERGIKRLNDFDEMATSLGLYFDRKGLLWPLILWFSKGNTALKILATTTVLTTVLTVTDYITEYVTEFVTEFVTEYLTEYVTEYQTEYLTEYVTEYLTEFLDKDRFTISLTDKMMKSGFELSEKPFDDPSFNAENDSKQTLFAIPVTKIPCVSIAQIPHDVDELANDTVKEYLTYTFYCRYINKNAEKDMSGDLNQYAVNYDWGVRIHTEGLNTTTNAQTGEVEMLEGEEIPEGRLRVSDAVWVMVIQDDEVILCAKSEVDENGELIPQMLPTQHVLETQRIAYMDRSIEYINKGLAKIQPDLNVDDIRNLESKFGNQADSISEKIEAYFDREGIQHLTRLMLRTENWRERYKVVGTSDNYSYYQVIAEQFVSDELIVERKREQVLPWVDGRNEEYHKYTVVIWLEGDDPQCQNELMDGFIGMNFQIKAEGEDYVDNIVTPANPPTEEGKMP